MTVSTTDCMRMQIGPGGKLMALLPPFPAILILTQAMERVRR
ncbi:MULTISPECIES: hypothetical protein [Candidatus Accumulibacter]|nr:MULTISPECIES: hypothetical protein [Candidatus Accumulibacter]HMW57025.1 hypothetical protein [Accumulibacter sp.]HNO12739.1 hypothetical protein [Accumulibacter sp.]